MIAGAEVRATGERATSGQFEHVTCPFCGILCDDLEVATSGAGAVVTKNACARARAGFERAAVAANPMVAGKKVELAEAIQAAAALIKKASLPLYGGLGTDVEGMRAVMALADRSSGVVDHALSEAQSRNFKVLQTSGWITTTLTEARNRADLIIIVGSDVHKLHPRFFERVVCAPQSMFDETPPKRTIVFIGKGLDRSGAAGPRIGEVVSLPCPNDEVNEVLAALRARMRGAPVAGQEIAGIALADIDALAERCRKASYGVMVWAPQGLAYPQADLTVHLVSEIVKDLNQTTRFAGLSLGGNEGAATAGAVCGWQSGYPLRVSFASGQPEYDALSNSISHLVASGEGDLLIWIASFTPDLSPPATRLPTIVLGTPGLAMSTAPAVFIPVGTPGADHAGRLVRCDSVVSLPLQDLKRWPLPRVADVLAAVEAAL